SDGPLRVSRDAFLVALGRRRAWLWGEPALGQAGLSRAEGCATEVTTMRVAMLSYGTRGDVQPMVGIALALQARGHDVVLAAPTNHVSFVERAGVRAASIAGDSEAILHSEQGRRWVADGDVRSLMTAIVDTFKALRD